MGFWEFKIDTFETWVFLGIAVFIFLIANALRRKIGFIRKSLLPTAIIAGLIILLLKYFGVFDKLISRDELNKLLESVTYHGLGLGVIALTLKNTNKEKSQGRQSEVFNSGLITVNTYLIQAIIGVVITVFLSYTFIKDLFPAAGFILPRGFGQGSGQAVTFGRIFEDTHGFVGGASFGLTVATIGFLV
ncbi:MAG: sodium/glutamate symporter, partial [Bacilli bacterium]|nr:sodium/glutamate symporter [Bacilli bacterium]